MSERTKYLFAYGTLMSADNGALGRAERQRLARETTSMGPATTTGRLYDLGRYPGLVWPATAFGDDESVHGEVFELADPERSLRWLDVYEGIEPDREELAEYARVARPVVRADGRAITAFVYIYRNDVSAARWMSNGRWPG